MSEFDKLVETIDLQDCLSVHENGKKEKSNVTIKKSTFIDKWWNAETRLHDIEICVHCFDIFVGDEKIGEMNFYLSTLKNDTHLFLRQLTNCSINRFGERKYCNVGTTLVNCLKKIARIGNAGNIYVTAMTPFSTPLPQNHNVKDFYEKMNFTVRTDTRPSEFGWFMIFQQK